MILRSDNAAANAVERFYAGSTGRRLGARELDDAARSGSSTRTCTAATRSRRMHASVRLPGDPAASRAPTVVGCRQAHDRRRPRRAAARRLARERRSGQVCGRPSRASRCATLVTCSTSSPTSPITARPTVRSAIRQGVGPAQGRLDELRAPRQCARALARRRLRGHRDDVRRRLHSRRARGTGGARGVGAIPRVRRSLSPREGEASLAPTDRAGSVVPTAACAARVPHGDPERGRRAGLFRDVRARNPREWISGRRSSSPREGEASLAPTDRAGAWSRRRPVRHVCRTAIPRGAGEPASSGMCAPEIHASGFLRMRRQGNPLYLRRSAPQRQRGAAGRAPLATRAGRALGVRSRPRDGCRPSQMGSDDRLHSVRLRARAAVCERSVSLVRARSGTRRTATTIRYSF